MPLRQKIIKFSLFTQILGDISVECKERALLLYKFFKIYYTEQEKNWLNVVEKLHKKIKYYKDLCKIVISKESSESKDINILEKLNNILFSNRVTPENLINHKEIIKELINLINQKRGEVFLMKTEVEIMEKEMTFWICDFATLKTNEKIREEILKVNVGLIRKNLDEELKHKAYFYLFICII